MPWELELWIVTEVEGSNFTCSTPLPSASPVPAHLTGARQQPVEPAVKGAALIVENHSYEAGCSMMPQAGT